MKKTIKLLFLLSIITLVKMPVYAENNNCETEINSYPVILDTDFASDCDDLLALRLLLCYQDQGLLDLRS